LPFLVSTTNSLEINPENFDVMSMIDRSFEVELVGQEIKDQKGGKIGKILGSQYNVGTAVFDLPRLFKNGVDAKYFLGDKKVIMWQPVWLKLQNQPEGEEEEPQPMTQEEQEIQKDIEQMKIEHGERHVNKK